MIPSRLLGTYNKHTYMEDCTHTTVGQRVGLRVAHTMCGGYLQLCYYLGDRDEGVRSVFTLQAIHLTMGAMPYRTSIMRSMKRQATTLPKAGESRIRRTQARYSSSPCS